MEETAVSLGVVPSAYRRDSAFVGLNVQCLVSQPVLCYQASAAIVRDILPDVNWP